jgi:hypothetical protein
VIAPSWPCKELHVGIAQEQVVVPQRVAASGIQRHDARLREVAELRARYFPGNAARLEEPADHSNRVVGRAGIADHIAVDMRRRRRKAALKDRRFVLDDYVEADFRWHHPGPHARRTSVVGVP